MEVNSLSVVLPLYDPASMGPWQNSHGSLKPVGTKFYEAQLQWGHDKIVMEVPHINQNEMGRFMLQWGHDKIVMEVVSKLRVFQLQ